MIGREWIDLTSLYAPKTPEGALGESNCYALVTI